MPNLVENGPIVLKRGFLNIFNIILLFRFYLPFKKDVGLHLNKLESSPHKDALGQIWLKFAQWLLRRQNRKNLQTDGQTTDDRRSEKLR